MACRVLAGIGAYIQNCHQCFALAFHGLVVGETSNYLREEVARLAPAFAAPPVTEHYEVSLE